MICGFTLGLRSVTYCFGVTVTLTSGLSSRKILSGVDLGRKATKQTNKQISDSPILFEVGVPYLVCECTLGSQSVAYCFGVTVTF